MGKQNLDREIKLKQRSEYFYARDKLNQQIGDYLKYFGLILSEGKSHGSDKKRAYMLRSGEKLIEDGTNIYIDVEIGERIVVGNNTRLLKEEIELIYEFLEKLRINWKEKYYKRFFRPKLKSKINLYNLENYTHPLI